MVAGAVDAAETIVHDFSNRKFSIGSIEAAPDGAVFGTQAATKGIYSNRYQEKGYAYYRVAGNGTISFPGGANAPITTVPAVAAPDGQLIAATSYTVSRLGTTTAGAVTTIATLPSNTINGDFFQHMSLTFSGSGILHAGLAGRYYVDRAGGERRRMARLNSSAGFDLITQAYQSGTGGFFTRDSANDRIVFHSDGYIYQVGQNPAGGNYALYRVLQAGGTAALIGTWTAPLKSLVSASDGSLYGLWDSDGTGPLGSQLQRITPAGVASTVADLGTAVKIAPAPQGGFYFLDAQTVRHVSFGGTITDVISPDVTARYIDLTTDASGRILLAAEVFTGDEIRRRGLDGVGTKLAVLPNETDGEVPIGPLAKGTDGFFYGVALDGGGDGLGTFYRVSVEGVFGAIVDFTRPTAPADIDSPLVAGPDGNFYFLGTGESGGGKIYRITPAGVVSVAPITLSGQFDYDENAFLFTSGGVLHAVSEGTASGQRLRPTILRLPLDGTETSVAEVPGDGRVTSVVATANGDVTVFAKYDSAAPAGRLMRFRSTGSLVGEHIFPAGRQGLAGALAAGSDNAVYGLTETYRVATGDNRKDFYRFTTGGKLVGVDEMELGTEIDSDQILSGDGSVFLVRDDDGIYALDLAGRTADPLEVNSADFVQWMAADRVLGIRTRGSARLSGRIFHVEALRPVVPPAPSRPELPPGPITLKKKKVLTSGSSFRVKGTVLNAPAGARLEYMAGKTKGKGVAKAGGTFALKVKLGDGRNVVKIRAISPAGLISSWVKVKITKTP